MVVAARNYTNFISVHPPYGYRADSQFVEKASDEFIWFRLRELADVPNQGMALFGGTLAQRRELYRNFRAFVKSAEVYWAAARSTRGSAAALPYYYAILQLAKAELLINFSSRIINTSITHGLQHRNTAGSKIRSDRLSWSRPGVFSLLYENRTGKTLPSGVHPKATSLLSLIPEIGLEMQIIGKSRPTSTLGHYAVASDASSSWSLLLFLNGIGDLSEPVNRKLLRRYEVVDLNSILRWREVFALSTRVWGNGEALQSKKTHSKTVAANAFAGAASDISDAMGESLSTPVNMNADFVLTPTLLKSFDFVLPLSLARYAVMFYLSSLVRYQPLKLDSALEGAQSYVMDSVVHELPVNLLAAALDSITKTDSYYEPSGFRL